MNQYGFLKYEKHLALTQERLKERVSYDPETGIFTCAKKIRGLVRLGQEVGTLHPVDGYRYMTIDCTRFAAHRLAWLYVYGVWPEGVIDHINGVRDDNRIVNLRDVSQNINLINRKCAKRTSLTGVLGIRPGKRPDSFQALIRRPGGGQECLGTYRTMEEAQAVYNAAKDRLYPGIRHIPT